jgi:adenine deaminase
VIECEGGIVLVDGGKIVGEIALPLYGLLTDVDAWTLTKTRQAMLDKAKEMGCTVPEPFMFLSFVTLAAFPEFAITDKGYIDCIKQEIMDPILKWNT